MLLLHGWGCNTEVFRGIASQYAKHYRVYILDFPGFGQSDEPKEVWGTEAYCDFTMNFIKSLGIVEPIIVAHSFGGRVAIRLAQVLMLRKIIMTGGAGVKPKRKFNYYIKIYTFKFFKKLMSVLPSYLYKKTQGIFGSQDYRQASLIMKKILVRVVNEDLTGILKNIKTPTLLIWGEDDAATPLYQAKVMEREIPNCGLVVLKSAGHYAFVDKQFEFVLISENFMRSA